MSATEKSLDSALVWFRRDLRTNDNAALYHALRSAREVWCAFVFDTEILDVLPRAALGHPFVVRPDRPADRPDNAGVGGRMFGSKPNRVSFQWQ